MSKESSHDPDDRPDLETRLSSVYIPGPSPPDPIKEVHEHHQYDGTPPPIALPPRRGSQRNQDGEQSRSAYTSDQEMIGIGAERRNYVDALLAAVTHSAINIPAAPRLGVRDQLFRLATRHDRVRLPSVQAMFQTRESRRRSQKPVSARFGDLIEDLDVIDDLDDTHGHIYGYDDSDPERFGLGTYSADESVSGLVVAVTRQSRGRIVQIAHLAESQLLGLQGDKLAAVLSVAGAYSAAIAEREIYHMYQMPRVRPGYRRSHMAHLDHLRTMGVLLENEPIKNTAPELAETLGGVTPELRRRLAIAEARVRDAGGS